MTYSADQEAAWGWDLSDQEPGPLSTVEGAILFALGAHAGQVDKAGLPYILHPLRVGASLHAFGPGAVIAGILHDVVEDTEYTLDDLADAGASEDVVAAVDAVTKTTSERSLEGYRLAIERAMEDPLGVYVKAADVVDNASRLWSLPDVATVARLERKYAMAEEMLRQVIPGFTRYQWRPRPVPSPNRGVLHWG